MNTRQKLLFLLTFTVLLAGRTSISGSGYLEDTDEWFYIFLHKHAHELPGLGTVVKCVFDTQALFPEAFIRTAEYLSIKPIADFTGKDMLHPDMLHVAGLYNIISSLLLLYVFYRVLRKLDFTTEFALTGVLLLGTLFNYNLYTRHFLPYDHALLFHLLATDLLLRKKTSAKTFALAGLFSALGLSSYFGSFMFLFVNGALLVFQFCPNIRSLIKPALLFGVSHMALFGLYEILAHVYESRSYLAYIRDYSDTVYMASADEGFSYLFIYMWKVEKWWGIFLLVLFFMGAAITTYGSGQPPAKRFLRIGIAAYVAYGAYVYFSHKMVFHGRILHPYFLFIVTGVLYLANTQKNNLKKYLPVSLCIMALVNYGFVIRDFNKIAYPRHTIYAESLFSVPGKVNISYHQEIKEGFGYNGFRTDLGIAHSSDFRLPEGNYHAVNIAFFKHFPDDFMDGYQAYTPEKGDSVVFSKLHFQSHPAYALEYCTREGRNFFIDKRFHIMVVKKQLPIRPIQPKE